MLVPPRTAAHSKASARARFFESSAEAASGGVPHTDGQLASADGDLPPAASAAPWAVGEVRGGSLAAAGDSSGSESRTRADGRAGDAQSEALALAVSGSEQRRGGVTPERSLAQRMEALRRANEVRTRRARVKRDLKAGRVRIDELLLDPPDYLLTAKVFDLLLAVPKFGRVKVNRALMHCRISPSKTVGGLSERQRNELVAYLRR